MPDTEGEHLPPHTGILWHTSGILVRTPLETQDAINLTFVKGIELVSHARLNTGRSWGEMAL